MKQQISLIVGGAFLLIVLLTFNKIVETVDFGTYHIKQAVITGKMTVKSTPGMYNQFFGSVTQYRQAGEFPFSAETIDGGDGDEAQPLGCTFMGNSTADVSGVLKYQLGVTDSNRLELHRLYGNDDAIKLQLVRNTVAAALKQTGPMFRAEEAFITRRGEFTNIVQGMIENGLYKTESYEDEVMRDGKMIKILKTRLSLDSSGNPIVTQISPFKRFGMRIQQFDIKDFDFDAKTDELIQKKKEAEQTMVVSRARAEKAKQDAITAEEEGKARIVKAEAEELEKKIREVTQAQKEKEVGILQAQKEFEVASLEAKKAKEVARKIIQEGEADARINKLKVQAGLTPQEKAEWEYKTAVEVAKFKWKGISEVKFPETMVIGGNGNASVDPFMAMGLESLRNTIPPKKTQ